MRGESEMTREDIIRMAREAGFSEWAVQTPQDLERFAALVAAAERERVTFELVNEAQRAVQEAVWAEREKIAQSWDALHDKYMADPLRRQMMLSYEMVANMIRGRT